MSEKNSAQNNKENPEETRVAEQEEKEQTSADSPGTDNAKNEGESAEEPREGEAREEEPKSELEEVKEEMAQLKDQHMRLFADFENHKKRTAKERVELYGSANMELMSALLPVLDDFKRALKNMEGEAEEGVRLIYSKFENILKQKGLKPMEDTTGKEFNVDTMEAITRIPAPEKKQKGKVIDEVEQGFYLGNKIIRYARVVVGE